MILLIHLELLDVRVVVEEGHRCKLVPATCNRSRTKHNPEKCNDFRCGFVRQTKKDFVSHDSG